MITNFNRYNVTYLRSKKFWLYDTDSHLEKLRIKWVSNSDLVYYGLAGKKSFRSLKDRLGDLLRHGNGKISTSGPHKGGEILWQLKDYGTFELWMLPTGEPPEPRNHEELILKTFYTEMNKLPFANRQF